MGTGVRPCPKDTEYEVAKWWMHEYLPSLGEDAFDKFPVLVSVLRKTIEAGEQPKEAKPEKAKKAFPVNKFGSVQEVLSFG